MTSHPRLPLDPTDTRPRKPGMNAIHDVITTLTPNVGQLVEHLELTGQTQALSFFQQVQHRLEHVEEEDELLELFMMLSMTAFQGFQLDPLGAMLADQILAYAEQIAHTYSVSSGTAH